MVFVPLIKVCGCAHIKSAGCQSEDVEASRQKLCREPRIESPKKSRAEQKQPPKITVVEIDERLPIINLEAQKELIKKAALRKLKKQEDKNS